MKSFPFPEVDLVIGIATGGIVPASLTAHQLGCPLRLMQVSFRAADNTPLYPEPKVVSWQPLQEQGLRVLLVDEVSVSGKTLQCARSMLEGQHVLTFVLKGQADYVLFPKIETCVHWPWKVID